MCHNCTGEGVTMRLRSTGLGKTELIGNVEAIKKQGDYLVMLVRTVEPVRWQVRAGLDGKDLRDLIKAMLTVPVILYAIGNIFRKRKEGPPPPADF